jgi:hypothetical protein
MDQWVVKKAMMHAQTESEKESEDKDDDDNVSQTSRKSNKSDSKVGWNGLLEVAVLQSRRNLLRILLPNDCSSYILLQLWFAFQGLLLWVSTLIQSTIK